MWRIFGITSCVVLLSALWMLDSVALRARKKWTIRSILWRSKINSSAFYSGVTLDTRPPRLGRNRRHHQFPICQNSRRSKIRGSNRGCGGHTGPLGADQQCFLPAPAYCTAARSAGWGYHITRMHFSAESHLYRNERTAVFQFHPSWTGPKLGLKLWQPTMASP